MHCTRGSTSSSSPGRIPLPGGRPPRGSRSPRFVTHGSRPTRWPNAGGVDRGPTADGRSGRLRSEIGRLPRHFINAARPGPTPPTGPGRALTGACSGGSPRPARTTESPRRLPRPRDPLAAQVVELHRRDSIGLGPPHEAATMVIGPPRLSLASLLVPTEMVPRRDQPPSFQSCEKSLRPAAIGAPQLCQNAKTSGPNSSATALPPWDPPFAASRARQYARPGRASGATAPRRAARRRRSPRRRAPSRRSTIRGH